MFRRKFSRSASATDIRPAFDEAFWTWYVDSYGRYGSTGSGPVSATPSTVHLPCSEVGCKNYPGTSTGVPADTPQPAHTGAEGANGAGPGGAFSGPCACQSIATVSAGHDPLPYNSKKYHHNSGAVVTIRRYFEALRLEPPSFTQIVALLKSPYTQGDTVKTFQLIRVFQLSSEGLFITNSPRDKYGLQIRYVGAENWENVMCYLDALLFSMFANLESFEPILFVSNKADLAAAAAAGAAHGTAGGAASSAGGTGHVQSTRQYLVNQLSGLMRVYVNMLRSGNLITTDLTQRLCEVLMKLGFDEAMSHKQQDCASFFEFLTETLSMPLLTFKIDIKHGGKFNKEDDEKYSRERILFVSIPDEEERDALRLRDGLPPANEPASEPASEAASELDAEASKEATPDSDDLDDSILLEECLEHYFNNSISVKRELERRATLESLRLSVSSTADASGPGSVSQPIPEDEAVQSVSRREKDAASAEYFEVAPSPPAPVPPPSSSTELSMARRPSGRVPVRTRSSTLSIWSLNEVDLSPTSPSGSHSIQGSSAPGTASASASASAAASPAGTTTTGLSRTPSTPTGRSRHNSVLNKEVSLPAWMFLRLLPFYTDDNEINNLNGKEHSIAKNSKEFVNRRPILPICLKRYSFSDSTATKTQRRIIIPPIINLPNFVADDVDVDSDESYKLILESAVCHRGTSTSSGHFVSVIRKDTNNLQETEEEAHNAPWYLYDDMHRKGRVMEKSFKEIFETEWPYMLFYRLVSSEECGPANSSAASSITPGTLVPPPGTKSKYWKDDAASSGSSTNNNNPVAISQINSNETAGTVVGSGAASGASTLAVPHQADSNLLSKVTSALSSSSIPIVDVSPLDSRFVDIRNKYFWYVIDAEKNYYKELAIPSRAGTREPSITISPQFRRNSQWSGDLGTAAAATKYVTHEDHTIQEDLQKLELNKYASAGDASPAPTPPVVPSPVPSPAPVPVTETAGMSQKWRLSNIAKAKKEKSPSASPQQSPQTQSLYQTISPIPHADEDHHPHRAHATIPPALEADDSKRKFRKRNKRKGDDYRKEKCAIM